MGRIPFDKFRQINSQTPMKKFTSLLAVGIAAISLQSAIHGAILLESANWTSSGRPASGTLGANNITFNTAAFGNAGALFTFDWGSMPFAASYTTTSDSAVAIGYTTGISNQTITFSQPISGLSLWFNYIDPGTVFDFTGLNWTFVAGNQAARSGNTVVSTGGDRPDEGFLINVAGLFGSSSPLVFTINEPGSGNTAGFTIGSIAPTGVPEPGQVAASLLLLGGIGGYIFLKRRKAAKAAALTVA